jgi:hypothetical protein
MVAFFKALVPAVIGIEARGARTNGRGFCGRSAMRGSSSRLGRSSMGSAARTIPPGAEALCEAMSQPAMRFVPGKTAEQQAAVMMVGLREVTCWNITSEPNFLSRLTIFGLEVHALLILHRIGVAWRTPLSCCLGRCFATRETRPLRND